MVTGSRASQAEIDAAAFCTDDCDATIGAEEDTETTSIPAATTGGAEGTTVPGGTDGTSAPLPVVATEMALVAMPTGILHAN